MPVVAAFDRYIDTSWPPTLDWSDQFTSTSLESSLIDYWDEETLARRLWTYYVSGSGFADTNGDGYADAGTVTSITIYLEDVPYLSVSGLNLALADVYAIPYFDFMENLLSGADTITGSPGPDVLQGWEGGDSIHGGAGRDILMSGAGDDSLDGGPGFDTVSYGEALAGVTVSLLITNAQNTGGAGTDTLMSVERLSGSSFGDDLSGSAVADELVGLGGNDRLFGNAGDDILDGGIGDDVMRGGVGDDTYLVDSSGDRAVENPGEGTDWVYSSANYRLRENVENLTLTGTAIRAYGNSTANRLVGTAYDNIIDGGAGADTMRGGYGDDTYYVDDAADIVLENSMYGTELIYSSVSFALGAHVENLTLTGLALRGNGNNLANRIIGNDTNNIINGGLGADSLRGGAGSDTYYVDNAGDRIVEDLGEGVDRVYSTVTYSATLNVDQVFLRGSAAVDAYGNNLDNVLVGNSAANLLNGRLGADDLRGGGGADTFYFDDGHFAGLTPSTSDRIIDFRRAEGDVIDLSDVDANSVAADDQAFVFIGTAAFSNVAGQLRYQQINGNTYVYGDINGDGGADFMIRLDGGHTLVGGDFIL